MDSNINVEQIVRKLKDQNTSQREKKKLIDSIKHDPELMDELKLSVILPKAFNYKAVKENMVPIPEDAWDATPAPIPINFKPYLIAASLVLTIGAGTWFLLSRYSGPAGSDEIVDSNGISDTSGEIAFLTEPDIANSNQKEITKEEFLGKSSKPTFQLKINEAVSAYKKIVFDELEIVEESDYFGNAPAEYRNEQEIFTSIDNLLQKKNYQAILNYTDSNKESIAQLDRSLQEKAVIARTISFWELGMKEKAYQEILNNASYKNKYLKSLEIQLTQLK